LLASRVYAVQRQILEYQGPVSERLAIYGATDLKLAFEFPLPGSFVARPALHVAPDAQSALLRFETGAPYQGWLLRFDHLSGALADLAALWTEDAVALAPSGAGWLVYGSPQSPAGPRELYELPFDPTLPPAPLGIVGEDGPVAFDAAGVTAWLPTPPGPTGEPRMRHADVVTGQTLGRVTVGLPGERVEWAALVGERLFTGTTAGEFVFGEGRLHWVDTESAPEVLGTLALGMHSTRFGEWLDGPGALLVWGLQYGSGFEDTYRAFVVDPAQPAAPAAVPEVVGTNVSLQDLGATIWVRDNCCGTTDFPLPSMVWHLDPATGGLVAPPTPGLPGPILSGPAAQFPALAATRDFTGEQVVLGHSVLHASPWNSIPDVLLRIDAATGVQSEHPVGFWSSHWLTGISIP
ncbi:MAG TPA: hypothetical protein VJP77_04530, partial [Planctomycetota bacterium]|nr:hypothetical protein [Planctomycetota bacterium]